MTFEQMELIGAGLALLWLGGAIVFARLNRPAEPYQLRRVPRAAAAFFGGNSLVMYALAGLGGELDIIRGHLLLIGVILVGMVAFVSVLIVDIFAIMLRATRTPLSLAGGIVVAILSAYTWLSMFGQMLWGAGPGLQSPAFFIPGIIAAAAALVWWSELPRQDQDEPAVFD